jgi:FkbM family methyltransferase
VRGRAKRLTAALRRTLGRDERTARRRFVEHAERFTPYVSVESRGLAFLVPTADRKLAGFFASRKRTELGVFEQALAALDAAGVGVPRAMFVDVGASIGTVALAAARAGFAPVLACEPAPANTRLLRANAALNDALDTVRVRELALSDRTGTATLDLGLGGRGDAHVLTKAEDVATGDTLEVRVARLDDVLGEEGLDPGAVAFLWLDVEGHEYHVLTGAAAVLSGSPPLVMELYPKKLRRAGGIDSLPDLLALHYTHVADLRQASELMPIGAVPELIERYGRGHTDLLLCRLG